MESQQDKIIDSKFIPESGSHTQTIEGEDYLIVNDAMYTFYQRTKGEFSRFFLALKDDKKILGCKCSKCGLVRVPPFLTHCPDCDFAPTDLIEVEQVGKMNSTPPITYFATALFQHMAPYGRGRVLLQGADTALSVNLYTTTGILVPGIISKGTEVKVVFRDNRIGDMTDIFCVPTAELNEQQRTKKGLQESEIDWEKPTEPDLGRPSESDKSRFVDNPWHENACGRVKIYAQRRISALRQERDPRRELSYVEKRYGNSVIGGVLLILPTCSTSIRSVGAKIAVGQCVRNGGTLTSPHFAR